MKKILLLIFTFFFLVCNGVWAGTVSSAGTAGGSAKQSGASEKTAGNSAKPENRSAKQSEKSAKQTGLSAKTVYEKAIEKQNVKDAISYVKNNLEKTATAADKRSLLYFKGSLEEQCGLYEDACKSYAQAAGIAAGDAAGMKKTSPEQMVVDAVRCALCSGNFETADSFLNSSVRSTKDEKIKAYINLYAEWSALCKAESFDAAKDSLVMLKAYCSMDSMKSVRPSILFTLWYITGEKEYSSVLQKEFPLSPEAAVVKGTAQIMSVPFWYFVPHSKDSQFEIPKTVFENNDSTSMPLSGGETLPKKNTSSTPLSGGVIPPKKDSSEEIKITRQQCGLFGREENAKNLVARLKEKGFKAVITTETRASGNTYYIVVVDENKEGTIGLQLRDAGFECYPVVE